jgi:hypothetical protein
MRYAIFREYAGNNYTCRVGVEVRMKATCVVMVVLVINVIHSETRKRGLFSDGMLLK